MPERRQFELAAYVAGALLIVFLGFRLLHGSDDGGAPVAVDPAPAEAAGGPSGNPRPGGPAGGRGTLWVHVAGAVRRPGVYQLPAGSRADLAVQRAGGPSGKADLTAVNLASPLRDGQQVVVPARGQRPAGAASPGGAGASGGAAGAGAGAASGPISLGQATVEQLETLDGIGPTLARRIVEYRDAHGGFRSIDELREVDGIGEKRFAALRDAVTP
jgi:competence protein ComEA